jgi:hypothetical protein
MDADIARAIFALTGTQHLTLKAVSILMTIVAKSASEEDVVEVSETLALALDSFDAVLEKTSAVIKHATQHG